MYGLIIISSIVFCLFLVEKGLNTTDRNFLWKSSFLMLISGLIGARIYHVLHLFDYYWAKPVEILKVWNGGLGIYGAIFGAVLAFIVITALQKKKHPIFSFFAWTDIFAFYAPLAQFFGRFANVANNELLPFALYESVASMLLFVLFVISSKAVKTKKIVGFYSGAYLVGYGLIRLVLEQFRQENWSLGQIYVAHIFSILFIIGGISIIFYALKQHGKNSKIS